MTVLQKSIYI